MKEKVRGSGADVSQGRLNQIAARKLQALGVGVDLDQDGRTLVGEWVFSERQLPHPAPGGGFIARASFSVVGHDRIQFRSPPLQGLEPIAFYELATAAAFAERVSAALRARMGLLNDLAARLGRLKVACTFDAERLAIKGQLTSVEFRFDLHARPDGVRVVRVAPLHGGKPYEVSASFPPLDIGAMQTPTDLEMELAQLEPKMRASPPASAPVAATRRTGLQLSAPTAGALTVGMLAERFGPQATLVPGGARLEVHQELEVDGVRYRFVALHEGQGRFHGKLQGPSGDRWSDRFSLENFPGVAKLAAMVLGVTERAAATSGAPAEPHTASEETVATGASGLHARVGEVWVMNVLIERESDGEVRYACVDVNGQLYGAARILPAAEFRVLFNKHGSGWRLCIVIEESHPDRVVYRQLDSSRQPRGTPKSLALAVLQANFTPEAASY